jgi:peptide/nickel transport system permease protein
MKEKQGQSPSARAFKRFIRNRSAMVGMGITLLSVVIALLGYLITPDSTPFANEQILPINYKSPGFEIQMLKVRKNREVPQTGFFDQMFYGAPNEYTLVPLNSYQIIGDTLYAETFAGAADRSKPVKYHLLDVAFGIEETNQGIRHEGETLYYNDLSGQQQSISASELANKIEKQNFATHTYYLGTDKYGRDILSQLMIGTRVSLMVGLMAMIISVILGVILGALAGYFGGWLDDIIMYLVNVVWAIPTILLVFAIAIAFEDRGLWQVFFAIGVTMWVEVARIVRGQVISMREMQFVEAAKSLGYSESRTIFKHILPNITGPIIVQAAANFASAILIEAGLSYLGLGAKTEVPTWGRMLSDNYGYIISGNNSFLALSPGIAIMLLVLAFNLLGNGLRDAFDVKTSLQGNR